MPGAGTPSHSNAPLKLVKRVQFGVLSPEEIVSYSLMDTFPMPLACIKSMSQPFQLHLITIYCGSFHSLPAKKLSGPRTKIPVKDSSPQTKS